MEMRRQGVEVEVDKYVLIGSGMRFIFVPSNEMEASGIHWNHQ